RTARSKFRWTRRDQWHVTVQYFGKVESANDLIGALAGPLANVAAPVVQISGAGGFPSPRRAAVVWLGVRDPVPLQAVHDVVVPASFGFLRPRDVIPYVPHLTLARLDPPKRITPEVEALEGVTLGDAWTSDELVLMESEAHRSGSIYRTVARLPLG
ncbi:MAG: RNA 2',3'-cyclic phosphodiesterase, partial [Acidimicrobiia bacterium]